MGIGLHIPGRYLSLILCALCFCTSAVLASELAGSPKFKQYLQQSVTRQVSKHWTPIRSTIVAPIKLKFRIHRNGSISNVAVSSADIVTGGEKKAINAVLRSAPFDPLPPGSPESVEVELQFETTKNLQLTVPQAISHYGPSARKILTEQCQAQGIKYPPKRLAIVGLKQEKKLLLFGGNDHMKLLGSYPLVSYSGVLGPKLKQGDLQIPEGIYRITDFQAYNMLALCVNYPNAFDRKNAVIDHRTKLGSDILVHGGSHSTGCLVVSDDDMEKVFVAVHDVGRANTELIIAPCNLVTTQPTIDLRTQPKWVPELYKMIKTKMLSLFS